MGVRREDLVQGGVAEPLRLEPLAIQGPHALRKQDAEQRGAQPQRFYGPHDESSEWRDRKQFGVVSHHAARPVPGLGFPEKHRHLRARSLDALGGDLDGRQVGVRIHSLGTRKHALEAVRPVLERLAGVAGDADRRLFGADGDLLARRLGVALVAPDEDEHVAVAGVHSLAQLLPVLRPEGIRSRIAVNDVRQLCQAGNHAHPVGELLCERRVLLGQLIGEAGEAPKHHALDPVAVADGGPDGGVARLKQQCRDVLRSGLERLGGDIAFAKPVADSQQRHLPARLVVDQARDAPDLRDALDLDAGAALDADVDVLARCAVAAPDLVGAPAELADQVAHLRRFLRGEHVRLGDHLD